MSQHIKPSKTVSKQSEEKQLEGPVLAPLEAATVETMYTPIGYADLEPHLRRIKGTIEPHLRFGVVVPEVTDERYCAGAQQLLNDPEITTWYPRIVDGGRRHAVASGHVNTFLLVVEAQLRHLLGKPLTAVCDVGYEVVHPAPDAMRYSFFTNRAEDDWIQDGFTLDEIKRCVQCVKEAWGEEGALEAMWYYDADHYYEDEGDSA